MYTLVGEFLSERNVKNVVWRIHELHMRNNGRLPYQHFIEPIWSRMVTWYNRLQPRARCQDVEFLNQQFIAHSRDMYTLPDMLPVEQPGVNVFRGKEYVQDENGDYVQKDMRDITPFDYGSLNLWKERTTYLDPARLRYHNAIPPWQVAMHTRNYDRSNQGLRSTRERASLGNPSRGYGDYMDSLLDLAIKKMNHVWSRRETH